MGPSTKTNREWDEIKLGRISFGRHFVAVTIIYQINKCSPHSVLAEEATHSYHLTVFFGFLRYFSDSVKGDNYGQIAH